MRIAFSNSSRILGGAEIDTEVLVRGLLARGHEPALLCRAGSPLLQRLRGTIPCEVVPGGFDFNPHAVWRCAAALRRVRPQAVMAMTHKDPRTSGVACRALGVPLIIRHSLDVPIGTGLRKRLVYGWLPHRLMAASAASRASMARSSTWLERSRISVIHNGIDVDAAAAAVPAPLPAPSDAVRIGFVGRFERKKGVRELAAAWPDIARAVPAAHLVLVGRGGGDEGRVRAELAEAERVHWLGFREDVPAVMKSLDLLVVPSWAEGFGRVVVEAMAAGTPVAAARAPAFAELITEDVEGRFFAIADPDDLARVVIGMARDASSRERMGEAGSTRARRDFSVARMLDAYERLFEDVIREGAER